MTRIDPVALTQALVRADTVNPPGHEDLCTTQLADLLSGAGFDCRSVAFAPRRSSLIARIGGRSDRAPLCFTGHVDVVPLGAAAWQHDPFGADIVDGRLYGRGSSDMKSGVAAFTVAAIELADCARDGAGLTLVITAGEETGCEGAFHMVGSHETRALLGAAGALVVGEPTGNAPLVGHKGAFWLSASLSGVTAHGSMPERGDNAIYKMARAALALEAFRFESDAHPLMGAPTLNVGTARGGLNINSVPDAAELGIDIRSVAGQDHRQVLQCLCHALGPQVRLRTLLDVGSVYTEPDDPWMQRIFALCEARRGVRPRPATVSYFTDAAALRGPLGMPPTVILGPGEAAMAHQTDEYCRVEAIHEATALYADLIRDWCGVAA
ncbi:M20 family metallopeptidase [uncultured Piscinibacter sp.]|uniref:M20 family metallopeptidase n=1 Tax=uncultured Piscinibacter sp. TaxID=1131835 RepID=UPI002617A3CA|nr:M20 family metallopeptidase [uncultured Piscinibacter sp.]